MTLEELTRKEHPERHYPEELDLFCYCVNAEIGHVKVGYTDNSIPLYRCTNFECRITKPYEEELLYEE